jgi:hypothetical protein
MCHPIEAACHGVSAADHDDRAVGFDPTMTMRRQGMTAEAPRQNLPGKPCPGIPTAADRAA